MLCNVCDREQGWGRVNQEECQICSKNKWDYGVKILLLLLVMVVLVLILFKIQYNSEDASLSAYSRIFVDYIQILGIMSLCLTNLDFFS